MGSLTTQFQNQHEHVYGDYQRGLGALSVRYCECSASQYKPTRALTFAERHPGLWPALGRVVAWINGAFVILLCVLTWVFVTCLLGD